MEKSGEEARQQIPQPNQENDKKSVSQDRSVSSSSSKSYSGSSSGSKSGSKSNRIEGEEGDDNKIVRYKYCCKICKHPDKSKRACVCVVPLSQRRADLGSGCRNCGCNGCSKEDYINKGEDPVYHPDAGGEKIERKRDSSQKRQQKKVSDRKRERSNSRNKRARSPPRKSRGDRESSSRSRSPEYIDSVSMKFFNFDRSLIGNMIVNEYQLNPNLLGFGIPQRTSSYLLGRPK